MDANEFHDRIQHAIDAVAAGSDSPGLKAVVNNVPLLLRALGVDVPRDGGSR